MATCMPLSWEKAGAKHHNQHTLVFVDFLHKIEMLKLSFALHLPEDTASACHGLPPWKFPWAPLERPLTPKN